MERLKWKEEISLPRKKFKSNFWKVFSSKKTIRLFCSLFFWQGCQVWRIHIGFCALRVNRSLILFLRNLSFSSLFFATEKLAIVSAGKSGEQLFCVAEKCRLVFLSILNMILAFWKFQFSTDSTLQRWKWKFQTFLIRNQFGTVRTHLVLYFGSSRLIFWIFELSELRRGKKPLSVSSRRINWKDTFLWVIRGLR